MPFIDVIGHVSFVIVALSLLMKDIILLRALGILSGMVGIGYNYFITDELLWVPIIWLTVFMLINFFMIVRFYLSTRQADLSDNDVTIWKTARKFRQLKSEMREVGKQFGKFRL